MWGRKSTHNSFQCQEVEWRERNLPCSDVSSDSKTTNREGNHDTTYRQQNSPLSQNTDAGRRHSGPVLPPGSSGCHRGRVIQHIVSNSGFSPHKSDSQTNKRSLTTFSAGNPSEGTRSNKSGLGRQLNKKKKKTNNSWQRKKKKKKINSYCIACKYCIKSLKIQFR